MATSVKVLLRNKVNKEGLYPLVVRIIKNRKPSYIYIGHYIDKKYWNEDERKVRKSHPNSARLNNLIASKLAEANSTLIELQSNDMEISAQQIKKEIKNPMSDKSFNELGQDYLNELERNNKLNQLSADKVRVKYVVEFSKSLALNFREIDEIFLRRFMSYLKIEKGVSQRSIVNNLVVVRTLFNRAIRAGIVEQKHYPFGRDKIVIRFPESTKVGLSIEEVQAIANSDKLSLQEQHTRNVWLFSFYLAGMRVGDVIKIKWSDIYDGRLNYRMNKNSKLLSLQLPEKAIDIISHYEDSKQRNDDFIFPEMKKANLKSPKDILAKTKTATKKFNKYLASIATKCEIDKKLTMHIARHTFGNISGDKIPIQTLQKLYRHSSITTTINYQSNFTHKEEDEALNKVLDF
ncbi:Tyrosine recombinase XerC [Kordia antarctica]|uniref:Tyrosine recombinase XerC n=1 Tax=Kordia antarctica TaxID=1218801 RepID=A0A7L4ZNN0_9FLAO|nr:site-specific integrase [Kordia antarctica]QHI38077.1 Tyrosine recombinase XerC [Kordia antarctica]